MSVEILTEDDAAILTGLNVGELRRRILPSFGGFLATSLPNGVWREGKDYFCEVGNAKRLRAVVSGTPVDKVFAHELSIEARAQWDRDEPTREAIAKADARCAAEKAARDAANKKFSDEFRAREANSRGSDYVDAKGIVRNAMGERRV